MIKKARGLLHNFMQKQNEALDIDEIDVQLFALPSALVGFRIAVVADLHMHGLTRYHEQILAAIEAARPELVLIAGDTIDAETNDVEAIFPFFMRLSKIARVAAVLGNNDADQIKTPRLRSVYERSGIALLEDETRLLRANGAAISVTGMTDPHAIRLGVHIAKQEPQKQMPIREALAKKPQEGAEKDEQIPSILLLHQPQHALAYAHLAPSLIVAGHAHGGQFRMPGIGGLYAPGQGVFPKYTNGLYRIGDSWMIVSRGLGNHDFPLRLNNRPHLPVIVLGDAGAPLKAPHRG